MKERSELKVYDLVFSRLLSLYIYCYYHIWHIGAVLFLPHACLVCARTYLSSLRHIAAGSDGFALAVQALAWAHRSQQR